MTGAGSACPHTLAMVKPEISRPNNRGVGTEGRRGKGRIVGGRTEGGYYPPLKEGLGKEGRRVGV